jgi:hypothetical protein
VRDFSQTWYTYDYNIGVNKYPGNAGEINEDILEKQNYTIIFLFI